VTISKDQIVQFLESQGKHEQASQANSSLPDRLTPVTRITPRCFLSSA
jgi:hypothetical protein